jgi:hypothetical protein
VAERFTIYALDYRQAPPSVFVDPQLLDTLEAAEQRGLPFGLRLDEVTDAAVVGSANAFSYRVHKVLKGRGLAVGQECVPNPI